MARVAINTGSVANDGTGDSLRIAGGIINDNFAEIYNQFGDGSDLTPTWDKTSAGINTTSSVGIGTTNPRFTLEVGAVGASGTSLYVNGNARVTGILTVGSSSIVLDGNANKILVGSGISFDGNTGIISATAFYAGGSIVSGGGGGGLNYWGSSASGISTTANVAIGTVSPTSKLTVAGNSLFSGIATFRNNLTLENLTSSSNTLRFGSNSYIDQSNNDVITFQINSGIDGTGTDSSFVFRSTEPGTPDQQYDALRVYSGGNYWNRLVRVYTNFHVDNNAFVGGDLQVGAGSTLIGAGSTLGSFKVGAGGTVINTTSSGLVGIGTANPTSTLTVSGNTSLETLNVSGVSTFTIGGAGDTEAVYFQSKTQPQASLKISQATGNDHGVLMTFTSYDGNIATIESDSNSNLAINTPGTLLLRADTNKTVLSSGGGEAGLYYSGVEKFKTTTTGVSILGIATAISGIVTYYGDVSNAADGRWNLSASGTDHYVFSGIGITAGLQNDPTLHLQRGKVYEFVNEMGAHPFQIQQEYQNTSGQAYNVGVVNNGVTNGTLRWEVPFNAPNTLYYQCTSHVGMSGTIHIAPSGYDEPIGFRTTRTVTTSSLGAGSSESVSIQGFKTYGLLKVDVGNAAWVTLYTDSTSRTNDINSRTHLEDPTPGSGVIAEVYTESTGSSSFKMTPGVIGWNNDSPTADTIYLHVLNNESTTTAIGVTITLVKMED